MTDVIVICFNCYHLVGKIPNFLPLGSDNRSRINGIGLPSKSRIRLVKYSSWGFSPLMMYLEQEVNLIIYTLASKYCVEGRYHTKSQDKEWNIFMLVSIG